LCTLTPEVVPNIPSKSRSLGDENKKTFDGMEIIRNKRIGFALSDTINMSCTIADKCLQICQGIFKAIIIYVIYIYILI
jgi:hypothetical protein